MRKLFLARCASYWAHCGTPLKRMMKSALDPAVFVHRIRIQSHHVYATADVEEAVNRRHAHAALGQGPPREFVTPFLGGQGDKGRGVPNSCQKGDLGF